MRVRRLVFWWVLILSLFLVYAGIDAALHPKELRTTASQLTLRFNKTDPLEFVHVGAWLLGAFGLPHLILLAAFGSGLLISIAALFVEE